MSGAASCAGEWRRWEDPRGTCRELAGHAREGGAGGFVRTRGEQWERHVVDGEGVNYAQARATYGHGVADAIFRELHAEDCHRAYVTPREHGRFAKWKGTGDRHVNGIVKNIVECTLED